jgi:hypothetical protein
MTGIAETECWMRETPKLKNNEWEFHCIFEVQKLVALQISLNEIMIYVFTDIWIHFGTYINSLLQCGLKSALRIEVPMAVNVASTNFDSMTLCGLYVDISVIIKILYCDDKCYGL